MDDDTSCFMTPAVIAVLESLLLEGDEYTTEAQVRRGMIIEPGVSLSKNHRGGRVSRRRRVSLMISSLE